MQQVNAATSTEVLEPASSTTEIGSSPHVPLDPAGADGEGTGVVLVEAAAPVEHSDPTAELAAVRLATLADIPSMQQLINGFAAQNKMLFRSAAELAQYIHEYFVYVEDDRVLGVCGLHPVAGGLAEVRGLAVSEDTAGRGVGRLLVEACVDRARELGVTKAYTLTLVPGFFEKLRFVRVDKSTLHIKVWYECYRCPKFANCDEIAMVRPLDLEHEQEEGYTRQ